MDLASSGSIGGLGLDYMAADFSMSTGIEGKWLAFSISGGNVPPSYSQLVYLIAESTSECEPGTLGLAQVVLANPLGNSISFCGAIDVPCTAAPSVSEKERQ